MSGFTSAIVTAHLTQCQHLNPLQMETEYFASIVQYITSSTVVLEHKYKGRLITHTGRGNA